MPIVPRQVLQPLNTPKRTSRGVSAAAFGGVEAEAITQVGGALGKAADTASVFVDDYNRAEVKRADTAFSEAVRELSYGENGFYTTGGTSTIEGRESFLSEVNAAREKFRSELSSKDSVDLYNKVADARFNTLRGQVDKYTAQQMEEVKIEASKGRTISATNEVIDAATNPAIDAEEFAEIFAVRENMIRDELEELGAMKNESPELTQELADKYISDVTRDTLNSVIAGRGWEAGKVFFETYKDKMDPDVRAEMVKTLNDGSVLDAAYGIVDDMQDRLDLGTPDGRAEAQEELRTIENSKIRNEASRQLSFAIKADDELKEGEADKFAEEFMGVVLDPNGDVPGYIAANSAQYRNFITRKGANAFQSIMGLRDSVKEVNEFSLVDTDFVDYLKADDKARASIDWNNPEIKGRMKRETWEEMVTEEKGRRIRESGNAVSVRMDADITKFAEDILGTKHEMFKPNMANVRSGFSNRIMGRLDNLAQSRKITTADIRREVAREFTPIQQAEPGSTPVSRFGERWSDKVTDFWNDRPNFLGDLQSTDLDDGHYGFIEKGNIPQDTFDTIQNHLKANDMPFDDHTVERLYFEGLRGNRDVMGKAGMNLDFTPNAVGPISGNFNQDMRNMHAQLYGSYSEDTMAGSADDDVLDIDAEKGSLLTELEGWKNEAYDSIEGGTPTIGVGHKITAAENKSGKINIGGERVEWKAGLTDEQVARLKRQDTAKARRAVADNVKTELNDSQMEALTSFVFNVGVGAFKRSTLLKKLNQGDFAAVPGELSKWVFANKQRVEGLANRRDKEAETFLA